MSSARKTPLKPRTTATATTATTTRNQQTSPSKPRSTACCGRIRDDWSLQLFALQEEPGALGRVVDVEASFAATSSLPSRQPKWRILGFKFLLAAWTLSILLNDLLQVYESSEERKYYLIYLTNWCHLFTVVYSWLSLTISLFPTLLAQQPAATATATPGLIVRVTWGLYSAVAVIQMAVALLFWLLEYNVGSGCPSYSSLLKHGGFMICILLEGLVLNSIPIRAKHVLFPTTFAILYLTWTVLHALLGIGNPFREDQDPQTDDDTIYGAISWRQRPQLSAQIAAGTLFLVIPVLFLTLWTTAIGLRRYVDATTTTTTTTTSNDRAAAYYKPMSA